MPLVATALAETALEAHELGLGNLQRYVETYDPSPEGIVVEDYAVVVPSSLEPGDYTLRVGRQDPFHRGDGTAFQGGAANLSPPSIAGPGDQPPGGGGPPPSPPQAPEQPQPLDQPGQARPDLIGLVRHATGESLEVQTRERWTSRWSAPHGATWDGASLSPSLASSTTTGEP